MRKSPQIFLMVCVLLSALLGPGYRSAAAQPPTPVEESTASVPGVLLVAYREGRAPRLMDLPRSAGMAAQGQELQALNALNIVKIRVPEGQEEQIRLELLENPDVRYVERDYVVEAQLIPNDPRWPEQYGPAAVNAPDAWDITTGSNAVILAVIDSGIDARHREFSGRLVSGYDFVQGDNTPQDDCGHGTHVAGIAAATGNNRVGVAGIDWHSKVMPIRVISDMGSSCSGAVSGLTSGIIYAVQHGARVINLSVGLSPDISAQALEDAVQFAYQHGAAVFAASGNNGGNRLLQPAASQYAMAVGSANRGLTDKASFSNSSEQNLKRMVVAPGVNILSTTPAGAFYYEQFGVTRNYGVLSGTSMATPFVAGAATLLASLPEFDTPEKIYQAITNTALDIGPAEGWDINTGYGLLQIDLAMGFEDFVLPPDEEISVEYDLVESLNCPRVEFAWDDASDGSPVPLVSADARAQVALTTPLDYAGQTYNAVTISANGYVSFGTDAIPYSDKVNYPIPWPAAPDRLVAPLWADLSQSVGGAVYYQDLPDRLIVEWHRVSFQGYVQQTSELTFQVIFYRGSGHIVFQYQTLRGPNADGGKGTVGVEYGGNAGTQYSYNQAGKLKPGLAILFVPALPGSTRTVLDCLFVTQEELTGCNQLPPFGAEIADPSDPPAGDTELRIRRLSMVARNWPANFRSMDQYADIEAEPDPPAANVCYTYSVEDILKAGGRVQNLFLAVYEPGSKRWERLPTQIDTQTNQLIAPAPHLSIFGVFALQPLDLPETGAQNAHSHLWIIPGIIFLLATILVGFRRRV